MKTEIKVTLTKKDYYKLQIKTYKHVFEGTFEKSEIRHLIQKLDNAIV